MLSWSFFYSSLSSSSWFSGIVLNADCNLVGLGSISVAEAGNSPPLALIGASSIPKIISLSCYCSCVVWLLACPSSSLSPPFFDSLSPSFFSSLIAKSYLTISTPRTVKGGIIWPLSSNMFEWSISVYSVMFSNAILSFPLKLIRSLFIELCFWVMDRFTVLVDNLLSN